MISFLLALAWPAPQTASAPAAGWTFKESSDPAKPKSATAGVRTAGGDRLLVRCDTVSQPIVSVQYIPKPQIAAGNSRIVTLTFNEAQADMTAWEFPGGGAYNGEAVEVFLLIEQIAKAKSIRVGFEDAGKQIGGDVVGPGGDALFRQVYAACGLPYAMPVATPAK